MARRQSAMWRAENRRAGEEALCRILHSAAAMSTRELRALARGERGREFNAVRDQVRRAERARRADREALAFGEIKREPEGLPQLHEFPRLHKAVSQISDMLHAYRMPQRRACTDALVALRLDPATLLDSGDPAIALCVLLTADIVALADKLESASTSDGPFMVARRADDWLDAAESVQRRAARIESLPSAEERRAVQWIANEALAAAHELWLRALNA